jgi:hypothetical protein
VKAFSLNYCGLVEMSDNDAFLVPKVHAKASRCSWTVPLNVVFRKRGSPPKLFPVYLFLPEL